MPETGKLEEHNETAPETLGPLVEATDETVTEVADAPPAAEALEVQVEAAAQDPADKVTKTLDMQPVIALLNESPETPAGEQAKPEASMPSDVPAAVTNPFGESTLAVDTPDMTAADTETIATEEVTASDEAIVIAPTVEADASDEPASDTAIAAPDHEVEEEAGDFPPDPADWDGIDDFADSVVTGLEQAGIAIEPEAPATLHGAPVADAPSLPEADEAFFAGWGLHAGDANAAQQDGESPFAEATAEPDEATDDSEQGFQSLSEIGVASAAALASDRLPSSQPASISEKQDELADAVQSALESIYGEISSGLAPSSGGAFGFDSVVESVGTGKPEATSPKAATAESLSPQDVILGYFDYEAKTKQATRSSAEAAFAPAPAPSRSIPDAYKPEPRTYNAEPEPYVAPQWAPPQGSLYQGDPSYPVPAGVVAPTAPLATQGSSRVLGAAAIGLVGGIAIAASLAVFVINAYGPQLAKTATATRAPDVAEPGYGPPINFETEDRRDRAVNVQAERVRITATDAVATPGQPAPLAISVRPERLRDQALVSITGMPSGARLNAGVDAGDGNWLLPPNRLNGLTINLPQNAPETVALAVEIVDAKGRTPLSDRQEFNVLAGGAKFAAAPAADSFSAAVTSSMAMSEITAGPESQKQQAPAASFSTQTVSAPPPSPPRGAPSTEPAKPAASSLSAQASLPATPEPEAQTSIPQSSAPIRQAALAPQPERFVSRNSTSVTEIEDLIREGNKRMREGDILQARQFYQKAVVSGDPEAALAMGRSYDPIYFARIEKKNAEPDAAKAFDWYRKAMDGGAVQTAKVRIENLQHFLNE
ncbi:hypothetical protein KKP04_03445 [Rhodomicrobium sp. Az07]|uniref:hypothetical protein n=1 Tax=Rhodomicrobium sp. Az07 TaxID=2839034 RepID=UPI001BE8EFAD|nr:hypothetical protein [Rhodomicrobium sp. Az07]MBT3069922.1 hypothetical protein [Rhodomicrobium sp. Az07]